MSSLGNLLSARITARLEAQLEEIYAQTLDHATQLRHDADLEFHETIEEQRLDMTRTTEDSIVEINSAFDDKLAEFRESTAKVVDEAEQRVELIYADFCERLDGLVNKNNEHASHKGDIEKIKDSHGTKGRRTIQSQGRRATSLPL
jgi:vacuolar-type H+-ATPase subunit H